MNNVIEYVAPEPSAALSVSAFFCILVGYAVMITAFMNLRKKVNGRYWGYPAAALGLVIALAGPLLMHQASKASASGIKQMQAQTTELYPSITEEQAEALWRYVSSDRPEGDFAVIRTMSLPPEGDAAGFTRREVSLVWNGEGYVLAQSVDGEKFEPLER